MTEPLQTKRGELESSEDLSPGGDTPKIRGLIEILSTTNSVGLDVLETRNLDLEEATIGDIHRAIREGRLTCRALALIYLQRIHAYSVHGPQLNAFVNINLQILDEAQALDEEFQVTGRLRPLHGIPVSLKDSIDTAGYRPQPVPRSWLIRSRSTMLSLSAN